MINLKNKFDFKIIFYSFLIGLTINILDTFTDAYFAERSFIDEISNPHLYELTEKFLFLLLSILIGFIASNLIVKLRNSEKEKIEIINELHNAKKKIKTLVGTLPICASCKKIRDENGKWHQMERYIDERSEAEFSHGICPECYDKLYKDQLEDNS